MTIGQIIKEYRDERGLSQRQFATMCNVSNGYISMLERGINPKTNEPITPSLSALKAIALAMNISLNKLLEIAEDIPVDISNRTSSDAATEIVLSAREKELILAYRANPAMQSAVDKLLGIEEIAEVMTINKKDA